MIFGGWERPHGLQDSLKTQRPADLSLKRSANFSFFTISFDAARDECEEGSRRGSPLPLPNTHAMQDPLETTTKFMQATFPSVPLHPLATRIHSICTRVTLWVKRTQHTIILRAGKATKSTDKCVFPTDVLHWRLNTTSSRKQLPKLTADNTSRNCSGQTLSNSSNDITLSPVRSASAIVRSAMLPNCNTSDGNNMTNCRQHCTWKKWEVKPWGTRQKRWHHHHLRQLLQLFCLLCYRAEFAKEKQVTIRI